MNNNTTVIKSKITDANLEEFKKLVRKAIFLTQSDEVYFKSIPNEMWLSIFNKNFNGNFNYAQRVILNQFRDIEKIDTVRVDREKFKIHNLEKATKFVTDAIDDKSPIIFITDFDNDGSLAQSIINEYLKIDISGRTNMHVEYAQSVNGNSNRGFTVDLVEKIIEHKGINPDKKFVIITADNGINSVEEQLKIHARFPNAEIVVTDHHNPDPEMVIQENNKAVIFNPHYHPTEFFSNFNISGASTVGVLLKNILNKRYTQEQLLPFKNQLDTINKLFKVSNLLDYVDTDPADKPEKDYVITKFLRLQPLLNINNSISKIITGEINTEAVKSIKDKIPNLNSDLLYDEAKNIHTQNQIAYILLKIYKNYIELTTEEQEKLRDKHFAPMLLSELNKFENYLDYEPINANFIEQLRPIIFELTADDQNTPFLDEVNNSMVQVFENLKVSETNMAKELRAGEVITKTRLENSVIAYTDKHILSIFNRKFLNKVYNDENPGFSLTLDSIDKGKVSGSFRSLYNISDILKKRAKLEKALKIKIETPGHEKAAGFIIKSLNPDKYPIDKAVIEAVNVFINNSIATIKTKEIKAKKTYLLTDMQAIKLIDKINVAIRGNVSNFERITPLLKLTPDTIWTDSYTTKQYSMEDICNEKKYGYITININFHDDTVIIPVELVRRIVANNYKDYMSLGYMDGGVFMAEKVILEKDATKIIDLRNKNSKTEEIVKVFEKDFSDKNFVELTREQIKDNPFFKYSDYGKLNFDLFERILIGVIDTNKVDTLAVFDVEANGFGNAKLMNFGSMNYTINADSGMTMTQKKFMPNFFSTERGEEYLLTPEQTSELTKVTVKEKEQLPLSIRKLLLVKKFNNSKDQNEEFVYYLHPEVKKVIEYKNIKTLPFLAIKNYIFNDKTNKVTFNREIQATMLAYLVNDNDFKVPHEMTNLTGITQEVLRKYGKNTTVVDQEVADFYKGKKVLFGAHNTPYDAKVLRANTKNIYQTLKDNLVYDSALFSRQEKLAYDDIKVSFFENIDGMPKIFFYNNLYSEFNLTNFIEKNENGYYPDRTNNYLLEIENGNYYLVDKKEHKKVKLQFTKDALAAGEESLLEGADSPTVELGTYEHDDTALEVIDTLDAQPLHVTALLRCMRTTAIPNTAIKYSVEQLSEQWMIHSLLLSDEQFDLQHVDLNQEKYSFLKKHEDALNFFQDNYHFNSSPRTNLINFNRNYENNITEEGSDNDNRLAKSQAEETILHQFVFEFLQLNKTIQQKFSDSWMYKKVLSIKDPTRVEVTNDLVDLVHYQTNIPKDKIRIIFDDAIRFKEKHNISHILQHEGHINGPWEGDSKGDVAFEDKLTFALLAQRKYDSYSHDVKEALRSFNRYVIDARKSFDKSDELAEYLANDSYSYRQGILYSRDSKTEMIHSIQERETSLLNDQNIDIVKFKMGESVLPPNTAVYAVTKKGVIITRQQIEEDSEKLAFILVNEQLKDSLRNSKNESIIIENARNILTANNQKSIAYKLDLSTRYKYVEFNKKDYQLTEFIKTVEKIMDGDDIDTLYKKKVNEIDLAGLNILYRIVLNYMDGIKRYPENNIHVDRLEKVNHYILDLKLNYTASRLEQAINNDDLSYGTTDSITELNFLSNIQIERRNPIKNLLEDHQKFRLINQFIEDSQNNVLELNDLQTQTPKI
jgi:hypothetical protein